MSSGVPQSVQVEYVVLFFCLVSSLIDLFLSRYLSSVFYFCFGWRQYYTGRSGEYKSKQILSDYWWRLFSRRSFHSINLTINCKVPNNTCTIAVPRSRFCIHLPLQLVLFTSARPIFNHGVKPRNILNERVGYGTWCVGYFEWTFGC